MKVEMDFGSITKCQFEERENLNGDKIRIYGEPIIDSQNNNLIGFRGYKSLYLNSQDQETIYEGEMIQNKLHGDNCSITHIIKKPEFKKTVQKGKFENDVIQRGSWYIEGIGGSENYEGEFVNGRPHGEGKLTKCKEDLSLANITEGIFVNGQLNRELGHTLIDYHGSEFGKLKIVYHPADEHQMDSEMYLINYKTGEKIYSKNRTFLESEIRNELIEEKSWQKEEQAGEHEKHFDFFRGAYRSNLLVGDQMMMSALKSKKKNLGEATKKFCVFKMRNSRIQVFRVMGLAGAASLIKREFFN